MADESAGMGGGQKAQQFLQLLPVTLAIAGLSHADAGKYFNDDQMDLRLQSLRRAFKHAKKLVAEVIAE
ncbi:MAG TPA: hypothetical protein VNC50_06565 [Planctomycetia bacterium]|nr:hypothetical protein [Planctomycetia bacterium]